MKKLIFFLVLIQQIAFCQIENSVFPELPYTELSSLVVEGDYIYTAGDCNTALVSKDAGQNWVTVAIEDRVKAIRILPGSNGSKAIYLFQDGIFVFDINTLVFEEISTSSLFLSSGSYVSLEVDNDNIYVISNQNIHQAQVGQYNWSKIANFDFDNDVVVASDVTSSYIFIGTLNGLLLSVNLDTKVIENRNDFMSRIYSFDMVSDILGYFTIQNFTYPIKTSDGGLTYTDLDKLPENIGVTGYGDNIIITVNTNRIYVSTDGGQTAQYIPIPSDGTYDLVFSKYMTEDGVLYLAGRSSLVAKTEDFGSSFINLNAYKRENLTAINIHPSGTGVAVGGFSSIIKTEDGGASWSLQDIALEGSNNYLNSAVALSQDKYFVAGSSSSMIVENDEIIATIQRGIDVLHYNEEGGYLIGLQSSNSDYSIIKSTDGGMSWETKAFLPGYNYQISQAPTGKIFVPGPDGNIYTSEDGGEIWNVETFGDALEINHIAFLDENVGIASTGLRLYKTTDGGATAELLVQGYDIRNLQYISENQIVYTTSNEAQTNIYESTNGGTTFTEIKEFCSQSSSSFRDNTNTIWFAQNGGHINKYKPAGSTSTKSLHVNSISAYPNPIALGQDFTIETEASIHEVILTSVSGMEIKTIKPNASNFISTAGLSTGIYTLKMKTVQGDLYFGKLVIIE